MNDIYNSPNNTEAFNQIQVPDSLDKMIQDNLITLKKEQNSKRLRRWTARGLATAAVLACTVTVLVKNPILVTNASKLPLIGHIFERMQGDYEYKGNFTDVATKLDNPDIEDQLDSSNGTDADTLSSYTKTVDGVTVTLSEIYCNDQALYVTMQLKSEDALPEIIGGWQCFTTEQYSFNKTQQGDCVSLEGSKIDDRTYAGILRFDLNEKNVDDTKAQEKLNEFYENGGVDDEMTDDIYVKYLEQIDIPDEFTLELSIDKLSASLANPPKAEDFNENNELETMTDEEWIEYMKEWDAAHPDFYESQNDTHEGPWTFTLNVKKNTDDMQVVEINDVNDKGIGFSKVVKDRFEITMYDTYNDDIDSVDYFPVMLDADGLLMDIGNGWVNSHPIGDHDVSKVDIFLMDYVEWMDNIKGLWWTEGHSVTDPTVDGGKLFKDILLEKCAYHTEVTFDK